MLIICTVCKRERLHHCRGLCNNCACWARGQGMITLFPKGRRAPAGQSKRADYWREYKRGKAHAT